MADTPKLILTGENKDSLLTAGPKLNQLIDLANGHTSQLADIAKVIYKDPAVADDGEYITNIIKNGGKFLLDGQFLLKSSVKVPSNTTINMTPKSKLTLDSNANCYLFHNSDLQNGNENITIQYFEIDGQGALQTRRFTEPVPAIDGYIGFGMLFVRVKNIKVLDGTINDTNAWGIAHNSCDGFEFKRLKFNQAAVLLKNTDGVSGASSNGVIEDISGFTGDDMVAISSGSGGLGGGITGLPDIECKNIVIRNIFPHDKEGIGTPQAVALYSRNNFPVSNVTIDNVKGRTTRMIVNVANYWTTEPDGIFNGILIKNIERYNDGDALDRTVIYIGDGIYDTLTIQNVQQIGSPSQQVDVISINGNTVIDNLIVDNIMHENNHPTLGASCVAINENVIVKKVFLSNCEINNVNHSLDSVFYKIGTSPQITRVLAHNLKSPGVEIDCTSKESLLSVNAPSCRVPFNKLTPENGDVIMDSIKLVPKTYSLGRWDYTANAITLENNWTNFYSSISGTTFFSALAYKVGNTAYLQGVIKGGTMTNNTKIGKIPSGLYPRTQIIVPVPCNTSMGFIKITADGGIYVVSGDLPSNISLSFDNISYPIGQTLDII